MRYNVEFNFVFSVTGDDEYGDTVTGKQMRKAILAKLSELTDDEIEEAVEFCDSYAEDE